MTSPTDSMQHETVSIGSTLKSLREDKNISLADIASKMHLDPRFITAIEEDNFDVLPDPIYVRGYIRSYSKLVGADADALVKSFEQHGGNFEPEIIPEIRHSSQTSSSDKPVKAFTYLIVFALVVLLFAWWQSNFMIDTPLMLSRITAGLNEPSQLPSPPEIPEMSALTIPEYRPSYADDSLQEIAVIPTDALSESYGSVSDAAMGITSAETLPTNMVTEQLPGALPPSGVINAENPVTGNSLSATVAPATANPVAATTLSQMQPSTTAAVSQTVLTTTTNTLAGAEPLPLPPVTVPAQTTGPDLIVLRLTADSWIEITDSTNTKVFFDLGRSGDVFNVRGTAPFDVLLGFSQAVSLEYNGQPFNAAPFSRSGVARFTLGQ